VLVEWLAAAQGRGAALAYESVPAQLLAIARISELDGLLLGQSG
jgi:ABC-type transporter Mla MlaB component